jgi:molybdenum cofactor cytidylyltransferase
MCSSPVNSFTLARHKIAVVLLAAGRGARMGGPTPKLLLPMQDGRPLLAHSLENALSLQPLETIVVVRPDLLSLVQSSKFQAQLPKYAIRNPKSKIQNPKSKINYVSNPHYKEGMGTSLAAGVESLSPETKACLVLLGDEPHVPHAIIERLVQAYTLAHPTITIPIYGDHPGPPTLFSRDLFPQLALLKGDVGGRQLLARFPDTIVRVQFNEDERPKDIDTPEDYQAIK